MTWPEDIARDLPNPQPEEPASLRSDILDELYDHLLSSLEHEQLTEADADAARKSVLSRFGNPATIACRLWWDAMWERIMIQRITLVFVALLCCCSIVATFLIWKAIENSQQATAALVAQVQNLSEREIVISLPEQQSQKDDRFQYLDWIPLTVKLKDEDGKPITDPGFSVTLEGRKLLGDYSESVRLYERPNESGIVDFGLVKPSIGSFTFNSPWESFMKMGPHQFRPGAPAELEITCPRELFLWTEKELSLQWPEDLQNENLWVYLWLTVDFRVVDGKRWYHSGHSSPSSSGAVSISTVMDPDGQFYLTELYVNPELETSWASQLGYPWDAIQLEVAITGKQDRYLARTGGIPYRDPNLDKHVAILKQQLDHKLYADLSKPQPKLSVAQNGMKLSGIVVLRADDTPGRVEQNLSFINVLPLTDTHWATAEIPRLEDQDPQKTDVWTYQPSDLICELVRERLKQIEAGEKPDEAPKTEAAEVPAETI